MGIWILAFTGATKINNFNSLIKYVEANDFETIFAIFFIIASLSGWYNFVCEVIIRPKIKFYIKKDVKQLSIY